MGRSIFIKKRIKKNSHEKIDKAVVLEEMAENWKNQFYGLYKPYKSFKTKFYLQYGEGIM